MDRKAPLLANSSPFTKRKRRKTMDSRPVLPLSVLRIAPFGKQRRIFHTLLVYERKVTEAESQAVFFFCLERPREDDHPSCIFEIIFDMVNFPSVPH